VAELAGHPAPVAVAVAVAVGVGVELGGAGVFVVSVGGGALVGAGDGDGIRKQPLSSSAALLATTANSAMGMSRCDMSQS
jgi:hypothetical protein